MLASYADPDNATYLNRLTKELNKSPFLLTSLLHKLTSPRCLLWVVSGRLIESSAMRPN